MRTSTQLEDPTRSMEETSWWDLWNTSYRTGDDNGEIPNELFARVSAVVNQITKKQPSRVLEIGCGTGTFSRRLVYSNYHGVDISPAAIEIAKQKTAPIAEAAGENAPTYEAADFHDWPLRPELADVTVCIDAVMCFRDQPFAVKKIAQSMRPGGTLVMTAINPFVYDRIKRSQSNKIHVGPVNRWLTRRELHDLITNAGLKIEQSYTIMPRGNAGILRVINARRLNQAFGPAVEQALKKMKEQLGLGQYRVVVARKT